VLDDQFEFGPLLDDGNDVATQFCRQRHGFDELVVLKTIANDRHAVHAGSARRRREPQHRNQFGLAARFETKAKFNRELRDLLAHVPLLIDLDGIDARICAGVLLLGDGIIEGLANFAQAMVEQIVESQKHGRVDAAFAQALHDFVQVDLRAWVLGGHHSEVALRVDTHIALAPIRNAVELCRVAHGPLAMHESAARGDGRHRWLSFSQRERAAAACESVDRVRRFQRGCATNTGCWTIALNTRARASQATYAGSVKSQAHRRHHRQKRYRIGAWKQVKI
jgi:hypothetical protein